jgi:hypothetical protein
VKASPVRSRADFRDFLDLPLRLHPRDRYVPLPAPVIAAHRRTAELYVVRDATGRVAGRTSLHRDAAFDAKVGARQLFGHTEFVDDDAVFAALVDVATARAEGRALFGPVALLPNQTGGVITSGFAQLGYYTEISAAQLAEQTDGLAFLLDEGLLVWLEKAGRPVAFIVAVPDVSEFLMTVRGRLGIVEQLRLLATRSRYRRDAVLVIKGTVPGEQGRGYLTLLSREVHRHLETAGYRALRSTFVERGNAASAAQYLRAGGRPLHGYTFYDRAGA